MKQVSNPLLIVISGPSGVGKDTVLEKMRERNPSLYYTVTVTTRAIRPGETQGIDYIFISRDAFIKKIENKELLEWAQVYGNYYGIPRDQVEQALSQQRDVVVKIDIQGAATIKRLLPEAMFIMIAPPSMEELEQRLKQRKTETPKDLQLRIDTARKEMESMYLFDYVTVNHHDRIEEVVSQIEAILTAEKCRVVPRELKL